MINTWISQTIQSAAKPNRHVSILGVLEDTGHLRGSPGPPAWDPQAATRLRQHRGLGDCRGGDLAKLEPAGEVFICEFWPPNLGAMTGNSSGDNEWKWMNTNKHAWKCMNMKEHERFKQLVWASPSFKPTVVMHPAMIWLKSGKFLMFFS